MSTTQHPTDSMSDRDFRYITETLSTMAPRPRKVCEALVRALSRRVVTLDEYDERFASGGYAGVEELLVERGLLDVEAQR
jgi:hypothetical protein